MKIPVYRTSLWLGGTFALSLLLPALLFGQSLGELARKERERRKQNEEKGVAVRVIDPSELESDEVSSDEEENEVNEGSGEKNGDTPRSTLTAKTAPSRSESKLGRDAAERARAETEWRRRMQDARDQLAAAQARYDYYKEIVIAPNQYVVDPSGRVIARSLEHLKRLTAEAKDDRDAAQEELDALRKQARREGVPPGWLR